MLFKALSSQYQLNKLFFKTILIHGKLLHNSIHHCIYIFIYTVGVP